MKANHAFFCNRECEYFPCHETSLKERFNCLFCYCPLYGSEDCGGAYTYTADGVKDCSACTFPHDPDHYGAILEKLCR